MNLFCMPVNDGSPWLDYQEATKTGYSQVFVFKIEDFLSFVLHQITVTYPAVAVNGNAQLPITVTAQASSTMNQFSPVPVPANLISSPSENYRLGALDETAAGQRLQAQVINYPCEVGDTITVTVSGVPTSIMVGCLVSGRKRGGQ